MVDRKRCDKLGKDGQAVRQAWQTVGDAESGAASMAESGQASV